MTRIDHYLDCVAADIARYGVGAAELAIAVVVDHARRTGLDSVALAVLASPSEPEIVRARAFGMVAGELMQPTAVRKLPAETALLAAMASA